jgi:hypothetical protein
MDDNDKRLLTEFLGECWHEWGPEQEGDGDLCIKCWYSKYRSNKQAYLDFTDWRVAGRLLVQTTHEGLCPSLLFDDDGHWQLCFDGIQPVGGGGVFTHVVEGNPWFDTPQEAICAAVLAWLKEGGK